MQLDDRVERYILGQMDEQEAERFEVYFLSNQDCLDQLELAEKLHQGIRDLEHDVIFEGLHPPKRAIGFWQKRVPAWSLAAALVVAVILPNALVKKPEMNSPSDIEVFSIDLAGTRNIERAPLSLNLNAQQSLLSFYIDTDVPAFNYEKFEFVLTNEVNVQVFKAGNLRVNNASTLYVNLGAEEFEDGEYQLQLFGRNENGSHLMWTGEANIQ